MPLVQIKSDGTVDGTRIIDQDGKEIRGWSKVTISIGARGNARAYVEFTAVEIDMPADCKQIDKERKAP